MENRKEGKNMELIDHKQKMKQFMKDFIKTLNEEHGYSVENAKTILISEAMDSAHEHATDGRLDMRQAASSPRSI